MAATLSIEVEIIQRLRMVTSNSVAIGRPIQEFCKCERTVEEILEMGKQIKDQIKDNEPMMIMIIGAENVVYFKNLKY